MTVVCIFTSIIEELVLFGPSAALFCKSFTDNDSFFGFSCKESGIKVYCER